MALSAIYPDDPYLDKDCYTEEEYFALEERSQARWEFLPDSPARPGEPHLGRIRAMSGGTIDHGAIAGNLLTALSNALRGTGNQICRTFGSDVKIHTGDGRNTFPDVSVVCGKPDLYRNRRDILTKQHYFLLAADQVRVEMYTREANGWHFEAWENPADQISFSSFGVTLAAADLYALVEFDEAQF